MNYNNQQTSPKFSSLFKQIEGKKTLAITCVCALALRKHLSASSLLAYLTNADPVEKKSKIFNSPDNAKFKISHVQ